MILDLTPEDVVSLAAVLATLREQEGSLGASPLGAIFGGIADRLEKFRPAAADGVRP